MNSVFSRANAIFAFTLTILAIMTIFCSLSTIFKIYEDTADVRINVVTKGIRSVSDYGNARQINDLGFISFNLDADFSKTFDWNTKELFLYLTAHYKTEANAINQIVLWDKIMLREDAHEIKLRNQNNIYYFVDDGSGLKKNNNITLTLSMNIIPNVGILRMATTKQVHQFSFLA